MRRFFYVIGLCSISFILSCCDLSKKHESKNVIAIGMTLSMAIDLFKAKNGVFPNNLEVVTDKYKNNIPGRVDCNFWYYIKDESSYILIYKKRIEGELFVFGPSSKMEKLKIK